MFFQSFTKFEGKRIGLLNQLLDIIVYVLETHRGVKGNPANKVKVPRVIRPWDLNVLYQQQAGNIFPSPCYEIDPGVTLEPGINLLPTMNLLILQRLRFLQRKKTREREKKKNLIPPIRSLSTHSTTFPFLYWPKNYVSRIFKPWKYIDCNLQKFILNDLFLIIQIV